MVSEDKIELDENGNPFAVFQNKQLLINKKGKRGRPGAAAKKEKFHQIELLKSSFLKKKEQSIIDDVDMEESGDSQVYIMDIKMMRPVKEEDPNECTRVDMGLEEVRKIEAQIMGRGRKGV